MNKTSTSSYASKGFGFLLKIIPDNKRKFCKANFSTSCPTYSSSRIVQITDFLDRLSISVYCNNIIPSIGLLC